MQLKQAVTGWALAALLWAFPAVAHAYPQFQLATGNARCSLCHYAPAGGGLLNAYGRGESADTISLGGRGDGDWLYGLYREPSWLKLGVDLRFASVYKDQAADPELLVLGSRLFPMQGDSVRPFGYRRLVSLHRGGSAGTSARSAQIGRVPHWRPRAVGDVAQKKPAATTPGPGVSPCPLD